MKPQKLPYDKFLESFKLVPRLAIDLRLKGEDGSVLYTKRDTEPFKRYWHFPGTFLLIGESISSCVERLANEELDLNIKVENLKLKTVDEDLKEPRGHVIHLVYEYKINKSQVKETPDRKFSFTPPEPMIPQHRNIFLEIS